LKLHDLTRSKQRMYGHPRSGREFSRLLFLASCCWSATQGAKTIADAGETPKTG
jgi:hypothetical protein